MNTAGAHELGYASAAIVAALLDTLIRNRIISRADASDTLNDAVTALKGLGNNPSAAGAIRNHRRCQLATCQTSHWLDQGFPF